MITTFTTSLSTPSQFCSPIVWDNFLTRQRTAYKITLSSFCLILIWWWKMTRATCIYEYGKGFSIFDPILLLSIQQCTGNIPILLNRACTGSQQLRTNDVDSIPSNILTIKKTHAIYWNSCIINHAKCTKSVNLACTFTWQKCLHCQWINIALSSV